MAIPVLLNSVTSARKRLFGSGLVVLGTACLLSLSPLPGCLQADAADVSSTWISNATGNWSDASLWDTGDFPHNGNGGFSYDAFINSGTVTLDQGIVVDGLSLSGGTIDGGFDLDVAVQMNWTGGRLRGTGVLTVQDASFAGSTKFLDRTMRLAGNVDWSSGTITFGNNQGGVELLAGSTLTSSGTSLRQLAVGLEIANGATLRHTNSSTTQVGVFAGGFLHDGLVQVEDGLLQLMSAGSGSGDFVVDGGELRFSGGTHDYTGTFSGAGTVNVSAGTVNVNGPAYTVANTLISSGTINFNTGATVSLPAQQLASGTIGGADELQMASLNWTGGRLTGASPVTVESASLAGGTKTLERTLRLAGDAEWSAGTITFNTTQGTVSVLSGNTFTSSGSAVNQLAVNLEIESGATLLHTNTGTTQLGTFGAGFANQGLVQIEDGVLKLTNDGSGNGDFAVNNGELRFQGGTHNYTGSFSGLGTAAFLGGTVNINGPSYAVANSQVSGGTLNLNTGSNVSLGNQSLVSGTIGGTDDFSIAALDWTGGTLQGTGVVSVASGSFAGGTKVLNRAMQITSDVDWSAGTITFSNAPGSLQVVGGATLTSSGNAVHQLAADLIIDNGATVVNTNSSTTMLGVFSANLSNNGLLQIDDGTVQVGSAGTGDGDFVVNAGQLRFSGGTHDYTGAFRGAGTVQVAAGTLGVRGSSYTVENTRVTGGRAMFNTGGDVALPSLEMTSGTVDGTDPLEIQQLSWSRGRFAPGGTATVQHGTLAGSTKILDRTLAIAGNVDWSAGTMTFNATRGTLQVLPGGMLTASGTLSRQLAANLVIEPGGTFLSTNTGTTTLGQFSAALTNNGNLSVTSGGTVSVNSAAQVSNYAGTRLTGGTWLVETDSALRFQPGTITQLDAEVVLSGTGSEFLLSTAAQPLEAHLETVDSNGALRILDGRDYAATVPATVTVAGQLQLGGGTWDGPVTVQSGGELFGYGSVVTDVQNSGTLRATGGALMLTGAVNSPTGSLIVDSTGTLDISGVGAAATTTASISHHGQAADSLRLGTRDLLVSEDYDNTNFGVGDQFNPRANVTGSGQIVATGDVVQQLAGNVTDGSLSTATLALGEVHVGSRVTRTYQVANAGTTGPALRGAIQTNQAGANITDPRLTGTGVMPGNFGPVATSSNSNEFAVTFDATSAGALDGQQVFVANNFDNVDGQLLQITAAAYNLAEAQVTPADIDFGVVHVGETVAQNLSVRNAAPAGGFSESLRATLSTTGAGVGSNAGVVDGLAPQTTDSSSMLVTIDTSTAGSRSGTAVLTLSSDGTGLNSLGMTPLPTQSVDVTAQVNHFADPKITPSGGAGQLVQLDENNYALDFGIVELGDAGTHFEFQLANDASAPADVLDGSWALSGPSASEIMLAGLDPFAGLAAGDNLGALVVSLTAQNRGSISAVLEMAGLSRNASTTTSLPVLTVAISGELVLPDGDFDDDGSFDCADIDALTAAVAGGSTHIGFDLTGDGVVDVADVAEWLSQAGANQLSSGNPYLTADANLDGVVDVADFNVWNANKFSRAAAWCSGDFNADGTVDVSDFNLWNAHKFRSALGADNTMVPEPSAASLLWWCLLSSLFVAWRPGLQDPVDGFQKRGSVR